MGFTPIQMVNLSLKPAVQEVLQEVQTQNNQQQTQEDPFRTALPPALTPQQEAELARLESLLQDYLKNIQDFIDQLGGDAERAQQFEVVRMWNEGVADTQSKMAPLLAIKNARLAAEQERADFVADRIDKIQAIQAAGIRTVKKKTYPDFERQGQNFIKGDPEILMVVEYVVDGRFSGVLLVWEKYQDATHYEVFKKNHFQSGGTFERVLFLQKQALEEERGRFTSYFKDTLGLSLDPNTFFVFLDTNTKVDRIYEYEIRATRVPEQADQVDYDLVLESKNLLSSLLVGHTATLFTAALNYLGSSQLAWTLALVNENLTFFGREAQERTIRDIVGLSVSFEVGVSKPKNLNDVLCVMKDSMSLFGVKATFGHMLNVLGGLTFEFYTSFLDAIDETKNVFSYVKFRETVAAQVPIFQLLLDISESRDSESIMELSTLSAVVPINSGLEHFNTLTSISRILNYVNDSLLAMLYSQDGDNFEKIKEIAVQSENNRLDNSSDDVLEAAVKFTRENLESLTQQSENVADYFAIKTGKSAETKAEAEDELSSATTILGVTLRR